MKDHNLTPPPMPPRHDSSLHESRVEGASYEPLQESPVQEPPVEDPLDDIPPLKHNSWLWQSILATLFCCIVFGIIGIVYAARVDSLYYNGRYAESEQAAKKAKNWTLVAVVTGLVYYGISIALFTTGNLPGAIENIIENNASGYNF